MLLDGRRLLLGLGRGRVADGLARCDHLARALPLKQPRESLAVE
jgi:hypothetical protein